MLFGTEIVHIYIYPYGTNAGIMTFSTNNTANSGCFHCCYIFCRLCKVPFLIQVMTRILLHLSATILQASIYIFKHEASDIIIITIYHRTQY